MNTFEQDAIAEFTRPWPARRGLEPSDKGHNAILVAASPADVTAACARHGATVLPDALGKTVAIGRTIAIVVRLRGHAWTHVLRAGERAVVARPDARDLSRDLGVAAIEVMSWGGEVEYRLFERGEEVENLTGTFRAIATFSSRRRARESLTARSAFEGIDAFAKEHDTYVSGLKAEYFFGDGRGAPNLAAGARLRLDNPGLTMVSSDRETVTRPELEKLDYVVLAP